ncbi:MAG: hypothetical protein IJN54_14170 [Lachnospiraceae bacterium]|nr:hypothetical protein [Lachnospiraceae bacterium]
MNYEIEFKMIEIKDLSKIQKRKMVKDDIFEADVEQVEDIADEYCQGIMARIETLFGSDCKVKYIGCTDRIGNFEFKVSYKDVEYTVIFQMDTYEWNRQFTIKIGYSQIRVGIPVPQMREKIAGYDHFLEKLKISIKNALIRDWYKCVWIKDNQSLELSREVYSDIYMAENELRAFISRIMIEHFGIDWHDRPEFYKLKASIEENAVIIKRNVPNFNNIDVNLYTVTLEKLMDTVKADIYSDAMLDSPEMQKLIKERIFATTHLDKMKSALDFLKNRYVKKYNIWEKFFKPLIAVPVKWEELLTSFIANRNHVAHNKLLDYMSKETMLSDTREFRRFIREAVIKFEEENCSEEVEETLQAIADQREYEQEARMEIIESESGVKIRDKKEILKLFQDTVDEIYTDAVNKVYFDEGLEVLGECKLQDSVDEQLLFSITGRSSKKLEIYGVIDIDDSEGTASAMQIRVYSADENIVNGDIGYMNGEAEYSPEQTSYMPVVMDSYDDSNAEIIKNAVDECLERERENEAIVFFEEKRMAEEDWHAEEMDALESNQE